MNSRITECKEGRETGIEGPPPRRAKRDTSRVRYRDESPREDSEFKYSEYYLQRL